MRALSRADGLLWGASGKLAAPSMVFTARYVASRPGIDIDAVEKLAEQMRPEDGCVSVIDSLAETAESIAAVTRHGLDYLGRAARRASLRVHEGRLRPPWPSPDATF